MLPTDSQGVTAAPTTGDTSLRKLARAALRKRKRAKHPWLIALVAIVSAIGISIAAGYPVEGFVVLFGAGAFLDPLIWIGLGALGRENEPTQLSSDDVLSERAKNLLATANKQYAYALSKMSDEDFAQLPQTEVDMLADAIHEGSRELQFAALNALEKVGGSEHLHSVNLLILKLRQASPHLAPQVERDAYNALLVAAERCSETLRTRATFQRERDTLLRASIPSEKDALLRPAGSSAIDPTILVRPLDTETQTVVAASVPAG